MVRVPEIGEKIKFFDDGKTSPSRRYWATIKEVVSHDEAAQKYKQYYVDWQEDGESYCSLNLEMYCDRCKERLIIRKEPFELKHINRVYGTEQFDKNTSLRDIRFLTIEDAEDFKEDLKKQETKY